MANLDGRRNEGRFCAGLTTSGVACRAYRLRDSEYCKAHDERTAALAIERMRDGYENAKENPSANLIKRAQARKWDIRRFLGRLPVKKVIESVPQIVDATDLRAYICEVLPLIAKGNLPLDRGKLMHDYLKVVQRSFEVEETATPLGGLPGMGAEEELVTESARPVESTMGAGASEPQEPIQPVREDEVPEDFEDLEQKSGGPILLDDMDLGDSGDAEPPPPPDTK